MKNKKLKISLETLSLRRRIWIAIALTTFLPLITIDYYLFSRYHISTLTILILSTIISLGWWLIYEIFHIIAKLSITGKTFLTQIENKQTQTVPVIKNEAEQLNLIFHQLSSKVKESVDELQNVSKQAEELNTQITQKMNIFSSILQANVNFSKGGPAQDTFQFLGERLKAIISADVVIIFLKDEGINKYNVFLSGINSDTALDIMKNENFPNIVNLKKRVIIDDTNKADTFTFIKNVLGMKNIIINPLYIKEENIGALIAGNLAANLAAIKENVETIELFSNNMSIVWEHHRLSKKIEDLEILDPLTNIYTENFFFSRLEEEIKRANTYQRPCGLIVTEITNYYEYRNKAGVIESERLLKKLTKIFKDTARPIDILGRIEENKIGLILLERSKRQSLEASKKLEENLASLFNDEETIKPLISFAIAENPLDGTSASTLFKCINSQFK